ncbi:MAG: YkvA family protein [Pseudomonadota bacterium]
MTDATAPQSNGGNVDTELLPIVVERQPRRAKERVLPKLLKVAGRIPFADDLAAAYYCALDPATPKKAKGVLMAAIGYFVLPADAVPDIIAGLGFTDDATVLATAMGVVGMHIREKHRRAARRLLNLPEPVVRED